MGLRRRMVEQMENRHGKLHATVHAVLPLHVR